jgi:membrane fusion protein (multidrug efflux system)
MTTNQGQPAPAAGPVERAVPGTATGAERGPRRRRFLVYGILLGLILAAGAAVGVWYYLYAEAHEWTDDAFIDAHIIQVSPRVPGRVLKVNVRDNQNVRAGDVLVELDPRDFEVRLAQARAGLAAAEATHKTAQTSLALVRAVTAASIDQAKAGVQEARSGVEMAQAQLAVAQSRQTQAQAQLAAARATVERARATAAAAEADAVRTADDLKRYAELFAQKRISQQQMDAATAAAKAAAAQHQAALKATDASAAAVAAAEADIQVAADSIKLAAAQAAQAEAKVAEQQAKLADALAAPQRVAAAEGQLAAAAADVARLKALAEQAELELSYTKIVASEDGLVTKRSVEPGNFYQPGQAMLALVTAKVWVVANFKESAVGRIRPGQSAAVTVDAYPGKVFKAHVDSIQAGTGARFSLLPPENATGNYVKVVQRVPVKIVFDEAPEPPLRLAPGMSVVPEVRVKE